MIQELGASLWARLGVEKNPLRFGKITVLSRAYWDCRRASDKRAPEHDGVSEEWGGDTGSGKNT